MCSPTFSHEPATTRLMIVSPGRTIWFAFWHCQEASAKIPNYLARIREKPTPIGPGNLPIKETFRSRSLSAERLKSRALVMAETLSLMTKPGGPGGAVMGPCLTTAPPETAPGELFAGDAATLKSEQLLSDLRGFFRRWRHSNLQF